MTNPTTPDTSNFSTLETQERNDNTTLANTTPAPELPDPSQGNEFEVEKRNEVHPDQSGTELTKDDAENNSQNESSQSEPSNDDEDWDTTKKKTK